MKRLAVGLFLVVVAQGVCGSSREQTSDISADIEAYCRYISEKNSAKKTLLTSPEAIARFDNGNVYNNLQKVVVVGLSKDLADFNKAHITQKLIVEECEFYQLNQRAKLQVQFAIDTVKIKALRSKLDAITDAKKKLNKVLGVISQRVAHHNDTIQRYYKVDSSLKRLQDEERQIHVELVNLKAPSIKATPLNHLLNDLVHAQKAHQRTLNRLKKQDNWSFQLQAGAQQNLATNHMQTQTVLPYFALYFRYNLGALTSDHQVDKSEASFDAWQTQHVFGVQRKLSNLITAAASLREAQEKRLHYLLQSYHQYDDLMVHMKPINTPDAEKFKQEIQVDKILANVEIKYVDKTVHLLQRMLL